MKNLLKVEIHIEGSLEKVWDAWSDENHIIQWYFASDDWHCPKAENDLRVGGSFTYRMESKDGSEGFDFSGHYLKVEPYKNMVYTLEDGRRVQVEFNLAKKEIHITQVFEAEDDNSYDLQVQGWQNILNNFKKHMNQSK